ncbi:MAG: FliM/FliN family flagellar motor switch protein [Thermomicrobium sp.]|uniref:flagellar motor switch protein FliM n=1 Tax=Thermomicrobium sp. TaxID=1969469 RepID=UPI001B299361|nr:FliM/FliN family flagellar motor switch protein [Thermomicrobium sp.]MBO9350898.1 FliM/FliN family flagellar motor switch protein [Thermomicrobium sp.]
MSLSRTRTTTRAARRERGKPIPYDFRRPDKFSKDHIRSIQSIHEAFDRFASNYLSAQVRSAVHCELGPIEQTTLGDYLDRLPSQVVLCIAELEPLVGRIVLEIDFATASRLVDRMLGGAGEERPPFTATTITEIELLLLRELGNGLFGELAAAWEQVIRLQPQPCEVVLSGQQIQGMMPSEIVLLVQHQVRLFESEGTFTVVLPASTLEPVLPRLNARVLFANPRRATSPQVIADLMAQLEEVSLQLRVELGRARLTVRELLALEPGDVLVLDQDVSFPLAVYVENEPCFYAFPGQRGRSLAIRIAGTLTEEWPRDEELDQEGGTALWPTVTTP